MRRLSIQAAHGSSLGFSLIEALAATTILSVALTVLARLIVGSMNANGRAQIVTTASVLAVEKMEQLRGLAWGFDALGLPLSDLATDLAAAPERPAGGLGLAPSPVGALGMNTLGYCDFVDPNGHSLGGGMVPPPGALYVRRWSIEPLAANPNNTLVLQVVVMRTVDPQTPVARLVTVRTRKAS